MKMISQGKSLIKGITMSDIRPEVFKIIIGGDGGIGKTTLLKVICGEEFANQNMTIGFEIYSKKVFFNGSKLVLQIWDLSGQDHFRFLLPDYFKGAHGVVLGFDMSRRSSFLNLRTWMSILMSKCPDAPVILIATKSDLGYHPTLNHMMAEEFVEKFKLVEFIEVSSKNSLNLDKPFTRLVEIIKGLPPGATKITFRTPEEIAGTCEIAKSPLPEISKSIEETSEPLESQTTNQSSHCPYCNNPLSESQIRLIQADKRVLCQNCYKMI